MLSDQEINELEEYLRSCTLQELPTIFGRALPLLFSELRIARSALTQQSEEFLNAAGRSRPARAGGVLDAHAGDGRAADSAIGSPVFPAIRKENAQENPRAAETLGAVANGGGDQAASSGSAGIVGAKDERPAVGGQAVRRKRGRPRKQKPSGVEHDQQTEVT